MSKNLYHKPCQKLLFGIVFAIFFSSSVPVSAATYYFSSSSGSDQYTISQAQNILTPWRSIAKLNLIFPLLTAGDQILFKRGDIFEGSIIISRSGSAHAPILFSAYGKGNTPLITGLKKVDSWKDVGNGIYESAVLSSTPSLVLNGVQQAMGRYPNTDYLSYENHAGNKSVTDNSLTAAQNWVGAEIVIRKNRWVIDRSKVTGQSGGTLSYASGTSAVPTDNYGYFIQGHYNTLDKFGEWFYDAAKKSMFVYFGGKKPMNISASISSVNRLVVINSVHHIQFSNLAFSGAGENTFFIKNAGSISIKDCLIDLSGQEAITASYSANLVIDNVSINHSLSGGINLDAGCENAVIRNSQIRNTALIPGMGKSGTGTYEGITSFGNNTLIEKNVIDSTGYNGIYFGGTSSTVKNNFINNFCLTKDDGAGIYIGDWAPTTNKTVADNIVLNGRGNGAGTAAPSSFQAEGIYLDDNTQSVTVSGNTVSQCSNNGIKIHNAKDIDVYNNTVFNNGVQLRLEQDHYIPTSGYIRNNKISNNIFFSAMAIQAAAKFSSQQDDIKMFGKMTDNSYSRVTGSPPNIVASVVRNGKVVGESYDQTKWRISYNRPTSVKVPQTVPDAVRFEYNATSDVRTVVLNKEYVDVNNKVYTNKITIQPYSSVILIPSGSSTFNISSPLLLADNN